MPASLSGHLSEHSWKSFTSQANDVLTDMVAQMAKPMFLRSFMFCLGFACFFIGPLIFVIRMQSDFHSDEDIDPARSILSIMLPFMAFGFIMTCGSCALIRWVMIIATNGQERLREVCRQASVANLGVTFLLKEEVMGYGKHTRRYSYFEISYAGVAGMQAVVPVVPAVVPGLVVGIGMPSNHEGGPPVAAVVPGKVVGIGMPSTREAGPALWPKCGKSCVGEVFCSSCGPKLR